MKTYSIAKIEKTVTKWKPILGLEGWVIRVEESAMDDDDALMEIDMHATNNKAVIKVAPEVMTGKSDRETYEEVDDKFYEIMVVHELCHCVLRDVVFLIQDDLEETLGNQVHELLLKNLKRLEERAIDNLSTALVEHELGR